jgi:hypothetical protein
MGTQTYQPYLRQTYSSDIVMTHVGESKDSHIVITRKGEAVVKPRWCGDRIPVFKDSLDENSIDELLISLGNANK